MIELMPVSDARSYAFQVCEWPPVEPPLPAPTVMAFGVRRRRTDAGRDPDHHRSRTAAMSTGGSERWRRTCARSATARRAICRRSPSTTCWGRGLPPLRRRPSATRKLAANLERLGLGWRAFGSVRAAVRGCDYRDHGDRRQDPGDLTADMIEPGMHQRRGRRPPGKTELHPRTLRPARCSASSSRNRASRATCRCPQTSGDRAVAGPRRPHPGRAVPPRSRSSTPVGFALEDYSALRYMRDPRWSWHFGERLALIPALDDPKDLFGFIAAEASIAAASGAATLAAC